MFTRKVSEERQIHACFIDNFFIKNHFMGNNDVGNSILRRKILISTGVFSTSKVSMLAGAMTLHGQI